MVQSNILGMVRDLMFVAKIQDSAKRAGCSAAFVTDHEFALQKARSTPPALIIVDLAEATSRPLELITALKADPATKHIPVIGFFPHVQTALRRQAEQAGCDRVIARSAFVPQLNQILAELALENGALNAQS
jgi:CheY-like chemotaxis protein